MKASSLLFALFFSVLPLFSASASDGAAKLERTAASPGTVETYALVPLGRNVCETVRVYGASAQCGRGSTTLCRPSPLDPNRNYCTTQDYASCNHTERECKWVRTDFAKVKIAVRFDPRATLSGAQKEIVKFKVYYKEGIFTLRPAVKSSAFKYLFPKELQVARDGVAEFYFELKTHK